MTVAAAGYSGIRRTGPASRLVVFATVLAFLLQSFIAQTHVHGGFISPAGITRFAAHPPPAHGKIPSDNSAADCPFCQAVAHGGAFLASAPPLLFLPVWIRYEAQFVTTRAIAVAATHFWQSRAPPRL